MQQKYNAGSKVQWTITRIVDYGAWVKLERGVEGLIPFSELAPGYIEKVEDVVSLEKLDRKVIDLVANKGKIHLSLKAVPEAKILRDDEQRMFEAEKHPPST